MGANGGTPALSLRCPVSSGWLGEGMSRRHMLERLEDGWRGRFKAMASPCEVLLRDADHPTARDVLESVSAEAWRVEQRFSRYRNDNLVCQVNQAQGEWVKVDAEFERLMDFADTCYRLSQGRFDITSGVLRRAWQFDGSDRLPSPALVQSLLPLVGWEKVERQDGAVRLPAGMELDFGGIGKEYAVDRALHQARRIHPGAVLVNFGGDIAAWSSNEPWSIGLEDVSGGQMAGAFSLARGALATSGDSRRYLLKDGVRYSHVLDPATGWPVEHAPRSVTVTAEHCSQAGMLSTLALLQGDQAEAFLSGQGVRYWILREDDA